jgi:hypothetical protein
LEWPEKNAKKEFLFFALFCCELLFAPSSSSFGFSVLFCGHSSRSFRRHVEIMTAGVLHHLRRRLFAWLTLRVTLLLVACLAGLALAALLLDAAIDLPDQARLVAPWVLLLIALSVIAYGFWQWQLLAEQRLARVFERAQPVLGSRLINAVQLSQHQSSSEVEEFLRREAIEAGRAAAANLPAWPAVRRGMCAALFLTAGVALAWLCCVSIASGVLRAVMPRFLDPHGDHPPYSRIRIEVTPGETEVLYGGQVEVRATVSRGAAAADKLWLVARSGTNLLRAMMVLAPDKTFFQSLANLREPAQYYVTDGRARSHRFPIRIRYTPQITLVEVTTTFPAYTSRPARAAKLSNEPQALPEGSKIAFRVVSNRPLKSGQLTLTPVLGGQVSRLELITEAQNNIVRGEFSLTEPVVFSLSVRDVSELDSADPRQGRFNILPDERPRIFVMEPGRDAVATPSIRIPVRVEATDDYAVSRVVWLRGLNRSIERPFNMKVALKDGPQSVEAAGAFDCEKLGLRPGDVIDYYFEAADNYPKGPNLAVSRLYRLQIISQEQYAAILKQAAARKALFEPYFRLNAWMRRLAERSRNLEKQASQGSDAQKASAAKEAEALAEDLAKYQNELSKLLQQSTLFDIEQSFRDTLADQQNRIAEARKKFSQGLSRGQLDPNKLADASKELTELAQAEDEDVDQPAKQIAAVAHLVARADTFVKLAQEQARLAELLRRFADRAGELSRLEQIEMQELAYQQRRIQEALHAMLGNLPELVAKLPEDPQYEGLRGEVEDFIKGVADAKIEPDLDENNRNLAALDGQAGHMLARQIAQKMDALISKCSAMPQQGKMCFHFKPSIQKQMGNTLDQILAAMGAGTGEGQGGRDGYGLFNDDVALYGPNVELAGEQAGGRNDTGGPAATRRAERVTGNSSDPGLPRVAGPGKVRLQPDAKFPLRYRDLVGEYFRVIAESGNENANGERK